MVRYLPCEIPGWKSVDMRFFDGTGGPVNVKDGKVPTIASPT